MTIRRRWFIHEPAEWATSLEVCTTPEKCRQIKHQSVLLVELVETLTYIPRKEYRRRRREARASVKRETKVPESFDAVDWAEEFVRLVKQKPEIPTDEGTMTGWFANALMRGFDEANRRRDADPGPQMVAVKREELEELVDAVKYTLDTGMGLTTLGRCIQPFRRSEP